MQLKYLEREKIGISDLVIDIPTIEKRLSQLESFLNDENNPLHRDIRQRHVNEIIRQMIDVGRIISGTLGYHLIYSFCIKNLGAEAPSYAAKDATIQTNYHIS